MIDQNQVKGLPVIVETVQTLSEIEIKAMEPEDINGVFRAE